MNGTDPKALREHWATWREAIDQALDGITAVRFPDRLWESMRYSVKAGGKRLRPYMVVATVEALGGDARPALPAACALELVHTQSLIHDDLPAMDDDDLRRGLPTNHKVFGEAQAILAGDAMLALAFLVLAGDLAAHYPPAACVAVSRELADATVAMVAGQVVDMAEEGGTPTAELVRFIHAHKTGALIRAATRIGGILGAASEAQMADLDRYGVAVGRAFQIADDVLDATSSAEALGKTPGKDLAAGKVTAVALGGLEQARADLVAATDEALAALAGWGPAADGLRALARYVADQVAVPRA